MKEIKHTIMEMPLPEPGPDTGVITAPKEDEQTSDLSELIPQYHVVLLNDEDHTYDYVIEMLSRLFGHAYDTALRMALEVDRKGQVIVDTTHKERADLKRKQITEYGPDWRLPHSNSSMSATIEPAE